MTEMDILCCSSSSNFSLGTVDGERDFYHILSVYLVMDLYDD